MDPGYGSQGWLDMVGYTWLGMEIGRCWIWLDMDNWTIDKKILDIFEILVDYIPYIKEVLEILMMKYMEKCGKSNNQPIQQLSIRGHFM